MNLYLLLLELGFIYSNENKSGFFYLAKGFGWVSVSQAPLYLHVSLRDPMKPDNILGIVTLPLDAEKQANTDPLIDLLAAKGYAPALARRRLRMLQHLL